MPSVADRLRALREDRVALAVLAVALLALLARLAFLGARVAHWDEARVAYWALDFGRTGEFEYRPIVHGPFLQQVNRFVFAWLGPTDFTMRLVVAVLGGVLPLVALLLRHRLRESETVALAVVLAVDPILLYYSRFMRADLPLAVFMLFSFAFFVRAIDTRRWRHFHAGVLALALGFTTKENVLLYLATWIGGVALLADHRLFLSRGPAPGWRGRLRSRVRSRVRRLQRDAPGVARTWVPNAVLAVGLFLVVIVYFYAPRTPDTGEPGLDTVLENPASLPDVIGEATLGSWRAFTSQWVQTRDHNYLNYLGDLLETLMYGAGALVFLAVLGFLVDRYADDRPGDLVSFGFYVGAVNVLGYPLVTDIQAPWLTVHVVAWFSLPAAAGAGVLYRRGRSAIAGRDWIAGTAAALVLLIVVGQIAFVSATAVYLDPNAPESENPLVQYAQPSGDLRPVIQRMDRIATAHEGTDVLVFGNQYVDGGEAGNWRPSCVKWFDALPLPWYFERSTALDVRCAERAVDLRDTDDEYPPIVIAASDEDDVLAARLEGYTSETYRLRTDAYNTTFYFDRDAPGINATAAASDSTVASAVTWPAGSSAVVESGATIPGATAIHARARDPSAVTHQPAMTYQSAMTDHLTSATSVDPNRLEALASGGVRR